MSPPPLPKISARGVERLFRAGTHDELQALGPIDLDIADGEFVCIVGPSGCGKSTLLRIFAGLIPPSRGEVQVAVADAAVQPTAMVFQDYGIYPWKTVEANVRFGLEVKGMSRREARQRAAEWIRRLGLADFATAYPHALSGGMRQRVSIARALAVEPEILLMDEPFAALDAQLRQILQEELLRMWQNDRRTVVFVTHSLEEAIMLGDRVVVMTARPGRVLTSVEVPIDRPRTPDVRSSRAFTELTAHLWELLRSEVQHHLDELNQSAQRHHGGGSGG